VKGRGKKRRREGGEKKGEGFAGPISDCFLPSCSKDSDTSL